MTASIFPDPAASSVEVMRMRECIRALDGTTVLQDPELTWEHVLAACSLLRDVESEMGSDDDLLGDVRKLKARFLEMADKVSVLLISLEQMERLGLKRTFYGEAGLHAWQAIESLQKQMAELEQEEREAT